MGSGLFQATFREVRIEPQRHPTADAERIRRWLVVYLAVVVGEDADSIDIDAPFSHFDIDSVDAVEMAAEFEKAFGCEIGAEFFLKSAPSISDMVPMLVAAVAGKA